MCVKSVLGGGCRCVYFIAFWYDSGFRFSVSYRRCFAIDTHTLHVCLVENGTIVMTMMVIVMMVMMMMMVLLHYEYELNFPATYVAHDHKNKQKTPLKPSLPFLPSPLLPSPRAARLSMTK